MSGPEPELPPGFQWLEFLENMADWEFLGWSFWFIGVLLAVLFNAVVLLLGAWLERRHDRELAAMEAATASVRVFTGRPPPGVTGEPRMVQTAIVMAPAPLGRFMLLVRRIVGGRVVTRQRDMQRTRRLALLRLREQARLAGAGILAGVEFSQIGVGRGRFALLVTGTALVGSEPAPAPIVTEAVGAEPNRHRRELLIALAVLIIAAAVTTELDYLFDTYFGDIWKRWVFHVK